MLLWSALSANRFNFHFYVLLSLSLSISTFYRTQAYMGSDLWIQVSLTEWPFWDLTDVTLTDEDAISITNW